MKVKGQKKIFQFLVHLTFNCDCDWPVALSVTVAFESNLLPSIRCEGVKGSSILCSYIYVSCLEFKTLSISVRTVISPLYVNLAEPRVFFKQPFVQRTIGIAAYWISIQFHGYGQTVEHIDFWKYLRGLKQTAYSLLYEPRISGNF